MIRDVEDQMQNGERELIDRMKLESIGTVLNNAATFCHQRNEKWWQDPATKQRIQRNTGELLMLCVSELAEAMEADRKDLMDDKLPHRKGIEVELADCFIRIMDLAGAHQLDIGGAFIEKMEFNAVRKDHTHEARLQENGKRY